MRNLYILKFNDNQGKAMSTSDLYTGLGVKEYRLDQDNIGYLNILNSISPKANIKELSHDAMIKFFSDLTNNDYYDYGCAAWQILEDGYYEHFGYGYDAICYSAIDILTYQGHVWISGVHSEETFSYAHKCLFEYICNRHICDIRKIYLDSSRY